MLSGHHHQNNTCLRVPSSQKHGENSRELCGLRACSHRLSVMILHWVFPLTPYVAEDPQEAFYFIDMLVSETSNKWHLVDTHYDKKNVLAFLTHLTATNKVACLQDATETQSKRPSLYFIQGKLVLSQRWNKTVSSFKELTIYSREIHTQAVNSLSSGISIGRVGLQFDCAGNCKRVVDSIF